MGRELKRVPLDFDYPIGKVWYGYMIDIETCLKPCDGYCELCKKVAKTLNIPCEYDCPDFIEYLKKPIEWMREMMEPPVGEGYQLWETTSEGSPISPVFTTLEELCDWYMENENDGDNTRESVMNFLLGFC